MHCFVDFDVGRHSQIESGYILYKIVWEPSKDSDQPAIPFPAPPPSRYP